MAYYQSRPNPDPDPDPDPDPNPNPNPPPKAKPIKGPILPDVRWKPIDLIEGTCVGSCGYGAPRQFKKTVKGLYHK